MIHSPIATTLLPVVDGVDDDDANGRVIDDGRRLARSQAIKANPTNSDFQAYTITSRCFAHRTAAAAAAAAKPAAEPINYNVLTVYTYIYIRA